MNFSQDLCVIAVDLSHFTPCHADCMTDRQTNVDLTLDSDLRETAAGLMKWQHHDSCLSKAPRLQLRPVVNHISTKLIVKQTWDTLKPTMCKSWSYSYTTKTNIPLLVSTSLEKQEDFAVPRADANGTVSAATIDKYIHNIISMAVTHFTFTLVFLSITSCFCNCLSGTLRCWFLPLSDH